MTLRLAFLCAGALLAGCNVLPRDVEGTSERVAASRLIRVGIDHPLDERSRAFLGELTAKSGARPTIRRAPLEHLVAALDHGELDLFIAPVRGDAALADEVALSPRLDGSDDDGRQPGPRAAVRNGENRWLMTVEHAAREGLRR